MRDYGDDLGAVKKEIMHLVQAYDNGLSEMELSKTMSATSVELRMNAINSLTNEGKIQLCKRGPDLIYRQIDAKTSNHAAINTSNLSLEERAVYQVVENAGNKGVWNREIRNQTRLPMSQMAKILKNLETRKLIKAVKSVTASKRKLYMLYDLEPDKSVTGGAWYSDTEFESEFVQVLHEQCYKFIRRNLPNDSFVTSSQVKSYINDLNISKIPLSVEEIEMILETIVFDGLIEKSTVQKAAEDEEASEFCYRAKHQLVGSAGLMRTPCGQCQYVHECRPNSVINPQVCLYMEQWFSS